MAGVNLTCAGKERTACCQAGGLHACLGSPSTAERRLRQAQHKTAQHKASTTSLAPNDQPGPKISRAKSATAHAQHALAMKRTSAAAHMHSNAPTTFLGPSQIRRPGTHLQVRKVKGAKVTMKSRRCRSLAPAGVIWASRLSNCASLSTVGPRCRRWLEKSQASTPLTGSLQGGVGRSTIFD